MASTRELRRRIKSVKNTSQITKAMQMVAATKMRKAQNQALGGRPYSENLQTSLNRLLPKIEIESHPLLSGNNSRTSGVIVLTTDKGLVGALNTNLFRAILGLHLPGVNLNYYTVGKKGRSFIARTGKDLKADFENSDLITFRQAKQLAKLLIESFLAGEIGEAFLIYPHFVSTLKQEAKKVKILPASLEELGVQTEGGSEFLIEPNVDELLDELLTHFVEIKIYQSLLETKASEHSARMVAMKNATDNAKELVEDLQLTYNQTRQDAITREILEISTASAAME